MASGVIKDASSGAAAYGGLSGTTYQFTVADTTPPTVASYLPALGATGQAATVDIVLTFSENVQAGTGNIVLTPASGSAVSIAVGDAQVSFSTTSVTINPTSSLSTAGMQYTVTMASGVIKDASSGAVAYGGLSSTTYQFTVANTPAAPTNAPTAAPTKAPAAEPTKAPTGSQSQPELSLQHPMHNPIKFHSGILSKSPQALGSGLPVLIDRVNHA